NGARALRASSCVSRVLRDLRMPQRFTASFELRIDNLRPRRNVDAVLVADGQSAMRARLVGESAMEAAPTPRIRMGRLVVLGSLSQEVVRRIVRRHLNEVRVCYGQALGSAPELAGRLPVRFVISGRGHVQSIDVSDAPPELAPVGGCVARRIRRWQFPTPDGGGIVVVRAAFHLSSS
ncbi:MAG: AgmX/PglI C-terminal domain-containing protein, partial [Myxococcota bacterium]